MYSEVSRSRHVAGQRVVVMLRPVNMSPGSISSWPGDEKAQKTNLPASSWRGPKEEKEGKDFTSNQIALDGRKESNEIPQTTSVPWLDYPCALSFNPAAHSGQPLWFAAPPPPVPFSETTSRVFTHGLTSR